MAKRSAIRVGLIGCGGNMRMHGPRAEKTPGVKLVAGADPFDVSVRILLDDLDKPINIYPDHRTMLKSEKLDAVIISTPHNQHYAQTRDALNAGLHVLVEKPLTITAAHAKALIELSKKRRRILHVSYQRHHWAAYRHVRDLVKKGAIGKLRSVAGYITQNWVNTRGWRLDPVASGGGMLTDTGSHLVGAMFFTSGLHVAEVSALLDNAGKKVDINTSISIRFTNDAIGSLTFVGNAGQHDEILSLHGDKGSLAIRQHVWQVRGVMRNGEPLVVPSSVKDQTPDEMFFKWIAGAKGYERPMYALQVARLNEAVYKSVQQKKPMKVSRSK